MFNQFSLNAMAKGCEQVVVDTEVDFICISKSMFMREDLNMY